ncbi:hypothetical protein [Aliarcobacter butzleri]|uniref:hypothetical protein n=1 Tax=Aliarcobacter butzleri TaxID=28197 RepID=UPI00125EBE37|nr:hypothetical protein [Aliarcobacter butzleri]
MKKILFISSILTTFIFTGCGTVNPNLPTQAVDVKKSDVNIPYDGETVFENVENSETLIKVTHKSSGGYKYNIHRVIVPAMDKISKEVKKRGYEYFQIVSPKQISNLDGFPINNKEDLASFLNPQISMATHELNFLETNKTLMDNQNSQNVVNLPFTYFGTTELELVIRMVKEPEYNEIVWNVNN